MGRVEYSLCSYDVQLETYSDVTLSGLWILWLLYSTRGGGGGSQSQNSAEEVRLARVRTVR